MTCARARSWPGERQSLSAEHSWADLPTRTADAQRPVSSERVQAHAGENRCFHRLVTRAGSIGRIAITPDRKIAYVTTGSTVTPINTATKTPGTPIHVGGGASQIVITPDGKTAYVTTASGVTVVSGRSCWGRS
jgi:DNA-binding beta-propeller fold protein YncE